MIGALPFLRFVFLALVYSLKYALRNTSLFQAFTSSDDESRSSLSEAIFRRSGRPARRKYTDFKTTPLLVVAVMLYYALISVIAYTSLEVAIICLPLSIVALQVNLTQLLIMLMAAYCGCFLKRET